MENIYLLIGMLFLFGMIIAWVNGLKNSGLKNEYKYKRKKHLLSIPERIFFEGLQKIIPGEYIVFPQVLLSNIVKVDNGGEDFWRYHNKINKKTIDFVIFDKQYLIPVIAIEYDGKSHEKEKRIERDIFVERVLEQSGIMIYRIKHQNDLNWDEIGKKLQEVLSNIGD